MLCFSFAYDTFYTLNILYASDSNKLVIFMLDKSIIVITQKNEYW